MTSFNSDYETILLYLDLVEKNTQQYFKMIRETLSRMKTKYDQRSQEIGSSNGNDDSNGTRPENWKP